LVAVRTLAKHVGANGRHGLVSLSTGYEIEQLAVHAIEMRLRDAPSPSEMHALLADGGTSIGNPVRVALLLERDIILPWIQRYVAGSSPDGEKTNARVEFLDHLIVEHGTQRLLDSLCETRSHYSAVSDMLDMPAKRFAEALSSYREEVRAGGNPLSKVVIVECPAIERCYCQRLQLQNDWVRIRSAAKHDLTAREPEPPPDQ